MKRIFPYTLTFLLLPLVAFAQTLNTLLSNIAVFLGNVVIPFLIGIAFLCFVFYAIKYFVISPANQEGREKARSFALYSILAFVFIIIFWGIIDIMVSTFGLDCSTIEGKLIESDYIWRKSSGPTPPPCM